jgi:hypothetical protein
MAKKKKGSSDTMAGCAMPTYKPPTTAQIISNESKYLGQRIAENHPKVKKMRDEISRAVEGAVKKVLTGQAKKIDA